MTNVRSAVFNEHYIILWRNSIFVLEVWFCSGDIDNGEKLFAPFDFF